MRETVSGSESWQRQLNGPQTSGREYRSLSEPPHNKTMRDGIDLLVDFYRPGYPVLIAASPYPSDPESWRADGLHRSRRK